MIFRTNKMTNIPVNFKICIGGREVERIGKNCDSTSFKFVGVHLDEFMTWEHHVNHVVNKISSANFTLNQLKRFYLLIFAKLFITHL